MKIAQRMESYMQGGMSGFLGIDFSPHKEKGLNRLSASSSHQNKLKFKENAIDDIGVVVVDGNFELYGKIIFGNKQILKMLGYQPENILDRTVHILMPRRIADLHN
jgi:PAS domain-containing protein